MTSVDQLTPVAQDYLKVIWSATEWGDPPITTKGLAARLGTTQANVSDTVKRLASAGMNIAGKFVENAMAQASGKGRGR